MRHVFWTVSLALALSQPALADDYDSALAEVKSAFGAVPGFMAAMPRAALPGAWTEMKGLLLSEQTALPPKTKALIAVAASAAIGCEACVWMDSAEASRRGASDEELREAVAIAALELHWKAIIAGAQIDLETIRRELGGEAAQ